MRDIQSDRARGGKSWAERERERGKEGDGPINAVEVAGLLRQPPRVLLMAQRVFDDSHKNPGLRVSFTYA